MLQFITQQNVLFYAIAVICTWGVVSQIVLRLLYGRLMKDAVRQEMPKGKFLRKVRQRYQSSRRLKREAVNVGVFIRKNLLEFRFLGSSLHGWRRMGGIAMVLCAALGAVGWYLSRPQAMTVGLQQNYILSAAIAELLIVLSYGITDTGFARTCLETVLQDNLENSYTLHAAGPVQSYVPGNDDELFAPDSAGQEQKMTAAEFEAGECETEAQKSDKREGKTVALPIRKKKREKESAASKDKRELKKNLSRLKEGIRETAAASETQKDKDSRILNEMDPDEQERVIREVLKEFLT